MKNRSSKAELGQFYTTRAEYIVGDLLSVFPAGSGITDPFAGNWDLLKLVEGKHSVKAYDIDPKNGTTDKRDTLINPPNYQGRWVITNPPYLARNKSKDKSVFDKYRVSDLYQASIDSIVGCEGGVLIVPLNFFCGEEDKTRLNFLSKYRIVKLKVFEEQVFEDTSYTVCAFSFVRHGCVDQSVDVEFYPSRKFRTFSINYSTGFRLGQEAHRILNRKSSAKVTRLLVGQKANTKLFLRAIDTGSVDGRIKLSIDKAYHGKETDRAFASINISGTLKKLTPYRQKKVVSLFNRKLEGLRAQTNSLFLTNFRNSTQHYARKRVSFDMAYGLIHSCLIDLGYATDLEPVQHYFPFYIEYVNKKLGGLKI